MHSKVSVFTQGLYGGRLELEAGLLSSVTLGNGFETAKAFEAEEQGGVPGGVLEGDGQLPGDERFLFTSST